MAFFTLTRKSINIEERVTSATPLTYSHNYIASHFTNLVHLHPGNILYDFRIEQPHIIPLMTYLKLRFVGEKPKLWNFFFVLLHTALREASVVKTS